jgi:hypothetical protein
MTREELARIILEESPAIAALIDAEATFEEDSKHFPYQVAGGSPEDERIAEEITEMARVMIQLEMEGAGNKPQEPLTVTAKQVSF